MTETWATPPVESSRGRIVQSAMVRKSCIDNESEVNPTMRISPSIDDCGPRIGWPAVLGRLLTYGGKFFRDDLTGDVDVCVPVEFYPYDRKSVGR